jgi:hypothetical protein
VTCVYHHRFRKDIPCVGARRKCAPSSTLCAPRGCEMATTIAPARADRPGIRRVSCPGLDPQPLRMQRRGHRTPVRCVHSVLPPSVRWPMLPATEGPDRTAAGLADRRPQESEGSLMRGHHSPRGPSGSRSSRRHPSHPPEFAVVSPAQGGALPFRAAPKARVVLSDFFTRFAKYFGLGRDGELAPGSPTRGSLSATAV